MEKDHSRKEHKKVKETPRPAAKKPTKAKKDDYVFNLLKDAQPIPSLLQRYINITSSDLKEDLKSLSLTNYKIIPYGSAVTGLFIHGSDLDLFIHPGKPVSKTEAISLVERLRDIVKQRKKGNQLLYKDVVSMTNGRVPVLKYFHKKLELIVNVNFTSHTGVNNSFLVKHLLTLDPRIQPMILLLKIYFKVKIPDEKLTSFNLLCLIIFALQNNKDPVLPPLRTFLDDKGSHILRHEQRWPVQFGLRKFATTNKLNLIQLIMDFCSFYANFDFTQRVVSPYMGNEKILTKALYDFFEELKCEDHKFTFNRVINIQDFFVLCVNLGSNCTEFKQICEMHHKHRGRYLQMKSDREVGTAFFTRK